LTLAPTLNDLGRIDMTIQEILEEDRKEFSYREGYEIGFKIGYEIGFKRVPMMSVKWLS
jgi:hypothetical protein